ncbi:hypothetical protein DL766_000166 [Monosporascus sp. MC13-8B]|nr:hypothetical protein DL763_000063 [Monosporascus cannonballus]RYP39957.1 hypothetical protein DL766_000166 [Monosporascus sp. MC13-8B]
MTITIAPSIEELTASLRDNKKHLLLAASGSVATSAEQPTLASLSTLPNVDGVYGDTDEWREPWTRGNAILHIELRRWADILVIAPLSANALAKIVNGMADSILTSVVRAWDARGELDSDALALRGGSGGEVAGAEVPGEAEASSSSAAGSSSQMRTAGGGQAEGGTGGGNGGRSRRKKKRIVVAPSMNTAMWRHPITAKQIRVLENEWGVGRYNDGRDADADGGATRQRHCGGGDEDDDDEGDGWFEVLRPQSKLLACGDRGDGAMCEWTEIVRVIEDRLGLNG